MKFQAFTPAGMNPPPAPTPIRVRYRMKKLSFAVTIAGLFMGLFQALPAQANNGERLEQLLSLSLEELLETTVTISTNTKQMQSKAPSVVSVITAEDIKATGATNLAEIVNNVPGVYVKANLFGFRPQITFRGASSTHTLLMVNGAPIKDLVWNSGIFWKGLPTSIIERVEIIRGPGSALFGSDASAGVINIITKTAGKIEQSEAGLRVGSFDTQTGWVQHGGNWNGFAIAFTSELSRTDGHNPFIASDAQGATGHAHYGWNGADIRFSMAKDNWRLLTDYWRHDNLETGLTGAGVLDPVTRGGDSRLNLQLLYNNAAFAQDWGLDAELRYRDLDYNSGDGFQERPPGFNCTVANNCNNGTTGVYPDGLVNRQRSAERQLNFEVSGLYTGLSKHAIRLGGGHSWQDLYFVEHLVNYGTGPNGVALPLGGPLVNLAGSPYAFAPENTRKVSHVFVQDIWAFANDWELTAGARYDHYSDFGGALTPRLGLVWQSTDRLTSKLMYGQAFRAPSYLELYSLTAASTPNPDLAPEKSNTWDLSFSYAASKEVKLGLSLYSYKQSDLIAIDAAKKYQNVGNNNARGVELEAQWQATRALRVAGNLSHRNDSSGFNTIPKRQAHLRTDWVFTPGWNWNVQAHWIGSHQPYGIRSQIDAYTLVDTTLRYAPRRDWEIAASIRNLFDVDAREYSSSGIINNLPLPGRNFFAEVRYKF